MKIKYIFAAMLAIVTLSSCQKNEGNDPVQPGKKGEVNHMPKSAKRGICYEEILKFSEDNRKLMLPAISWTYNWGKSTSDEFASGFDAAGVDFCPMVWSGTPDVAAMRAFVEKHPNTKYLLAFNEPNLEDQANMVPSKAAELWPAVVAAAKELNLKLVSPAMNYGTLAGYSDPVKWLDEFFRQPGVSIDDIDAISVHCYMSSLGGLTGFIEKFRKYNKPVWLTEFCAWDPAPKDADAQCEYMSQALNYLEQEPLVERYSWFMLKTSAGLNKVPYNQLVTKDLTPQLTPQGEIYTMFSSFDKNTYLNTVRAIHAGEYVATSNNAILLRPTTDMEVYGAAGKNGLMLSSLGRGTELTYQVQVDNDAHSLIIHYCGYANVQLKVTIDGKEMGTFELTKNGSVTEWTSKAFPIEIKAGLHTFSIVSESGSCSYSGFEIK